MKGISHNQKTVYKNRIKEDAQHGDKNNEKQCIPTGKLFFKESLPFKLAMGRIDTFDDVVVLLLFCPTNS